MAEIEVALEKSPGLAMAWASKGVILLSMQKHQDAIAAFNKALAKEPKHYESLLGRGNVYVGLRQFDKAQADYQAAIKSQPARHEGHANLGAALMAMGKNKEALEALNASIKLRPLQRIAFDNRAQVYLHMRDFNKAGADFDFICKLYPDDKSAQTNRAILFKVSGDFPKAIAELTKLVEADEEDDKARIFLADSYRQTKELAVAITHYDKLCDKGSALGQWHFDAFYERGTCHRRLKDFEKARADFDEAERINAQHPKLIIAQAELLAAEGKTTEAKDKLKNALAMADQFKKMMPCEGAVLIYGAYAMSVSASIKTTAKAPKAEIDKDIDDSLKRFEEALNAGFWDYVSFETEFYFTTVRESPKFKSLMKSRKK